MEQFEQKQEQWVDRDGSPFCIYGDPAYPVRPYLQSPFKQGQLTADQVAFNQSMSSCTEAVEWGFGKIISLFAFLDYKKTSRFFYSQWESTIFLVRFSPIAILVCIVLKVHCTLISNHPLWKNTLAE
jgi:hypothetical protein